MKNILLIGGAGFIGSNIIKRMTKESDDYNLFVIEPKGANISRLSGLPINLTYANLADIDVIAELVEQQHIDTIVHLVSTLVPGSSYDEYLQEFKNVIFPSIELMELCAAKKIKFVYFSSGGTIYGNRKKPVPFIETDQMAPISYYGWSKQMMENGIHFKHRTQGLQYLIVRPSNPYGAGQSLNGKQGLVAVALGHILSGEAIHIWGDGSAIRDYIYIDDLCEAFCQLILKDVYNITLNIGSGVGYSVNDVLAFVKIATGRDLKVTYDAARPADVSTMILDNSKLMELIDLKFTPLLKGIRLFYELLIDYHAVS